MARLRSMEEEGKGGFPACNLLGALWANTQACFVRNALILFVEKGILESVAYQRVRKTPGATDQLKDISLARCNIFLKRPYYSDITQQKKKNK